MPAYHNIIRGTRVNPPMALGLSARLRYIHPVGYWCETAAKKNHTSWKHRTATTERIANRHRESCEPCGSNCGKIVLRKSHIFVVVVIISSHHTNHKQRNITTSRSENILYTAADTSEIRFFLRISSVYEGHFGIAFIFGKSWSSTRAASSDEVIRRE